MENHHFDIVLIANQLDVYFNEKGDLLAPDKKKELERLKEELFDCDSKPWHIKHKISQVLSL